jgi:predicted dehydrogenase
MKNLVEQNGIGELRGIYFTMIFPRSWSQYSGSKQLNLRRGIEDSILDLGNHAFDYFLWLIKSNPEKVYAKKIKDLNKESDEVAVITVRFSNNVIATAITRWVGDEYFKFKETNISGKMIVELLGYDRTVIMDAYHQQLVTHSGNNQTKFTYWGLLDVNQAVMSFLLSIINKNTIRSNAKNAMESLKLVLAAHESIELGKPVYL